MLVFDNSVASAELGNRVATTLRLPSDDVAVSNEGQNVADVIVILAGDQSDSRYWRGLQLLRAGYAREMFLDASKYVGTQLDECPALEHADSDGSWHP